MKLEPPVEQYLTGVKPTHSPLSKVSSHSKAWTQDEVLTLLEKAGYLNSERKPTKLAAQKGVIDLCEGKVLWNLLETKRALIAQEQVESQLKASQAASRQRKLNSEPAWVDLGTVGTYFGVSNIVVGKWLDKLGLRALPKVQKTESGNIDMLDMANQAKEKQAKGFIGKEPTEKAFNMGLARTITVTNRKKKEIDIVQWNLDLCKAVLVRAGHELDTDHTAFLKGKGKNSDVKVITADDRAKELYDKWKTLKKNGRHADAEKVFEKQPKVVLVKVEVLMNRPGSLTS